MAITSLQKSHTNMNFCFCEITCDCIRATPEITISPPSQPSLFLPFLQRGPQIYWAHPPMHTFLLREELSPPPRPHTYIF